MRMIEKVARQIFSANTGTEYYGVYHPAFEHEQEHWEILAAAAIEAMLEPTEAMIEAGTAADWVGELESRAGRSIMPTERPDWLDPGEEDHVQDRRGIWSAMIDAALKESEETK